MRRSKTSLLKLPSKITPSVTSLLTGENFSKQSDEIRANYIIPCELPELIYPRGLIAGIEKAFLNKVSERIAVLIKIPFEFIGF